MNAYLDDFYASKLRALLTGSLRPRPQTPPAPVYIGPPKLEKGTLCAGAVETWHQRSSFCCAFATTHAKRHDKWVPVCPVHARDFNYIPSDVCGRYPSWMQTEVFTKDGKTRKRGPVAGRRLRFAKGVQWFRKTA